MCKSGLDWDQSLDQPDFSAWEGWVKFMVNTGLIKLPRRLLKEKEDAGLRELNVCCDESRMGYGAVPYTWRRLANKSAYSGFLFMKSRMAPMKPATIPRLEMSAVLLGAKFGKLVKAASPNAFIGI